MKFTLDKIVLYILICIIILAAVGGFVYYQNQNSYKPLTWYKFHDVELQFRDDLRLAQNISIYPDQKSILDKVWDTDITKINIVYVPTTESSTENSMLSLSIIEIRYKLDLAYR